MSVTLKMSYGDWVLLSDGTLQIAQDAEKCAQDMGEAFLNNRDPEDPSWYNGSELYRLDENPTFYVQAGLAADMLIRKMLEEALLRLKALQSEDAYCSDAERIAYLKVLKVLRIGASSYAFYVVAVTDTDEEVPQTFTINLLPQFPAGLAQSATGHQLMSGSSKKTFL